MAANDKISSASVADEIAAAEANLRLAQERLNAARNRAGEQEYCFDYEASTKQASVMQVSESQAPEASACASFVSNVSSELPLYSTETAPVYKEPTKDHIAAGFFAIFFGSLGLHKFYLRLNGPGLIILGVSIVGGLLSFGTLLAVTALLGIAEGIVYLAMSQERFEQIYVKTSSPKQWF